MTSAASVGVSTVSTLETGPGASPRAALHRVTTKSFAIDHEHEGDTDDLHE